MSLNDSMKIVESMIKKLKLVSGPIGDIVKKKIHAVTEKNSRLY
jgi:acid stress-induced BolA-like protein IbaG/YrbA